MTKKMMVLLFLLAASAQWSCSSQCGQGQGQVQGQEDATIAPPPCPLFTGMKNFDYRQWLAAVAAAIPPGHKMLAGGFKDDIVWVVTYDPHLRVLGGFLETAHHECRDTHVLVTDANTGEDLMDWWGEEGYIPSRQIPNLNGWINISIPLGFFYEVPRTTDVVKFVVKFEDGDEDEVKKPVVDESIWVIQ